jgi:dihydroorotase/N-acyl-D-amino-acid deacylase
MKACRLVPTIGSTVCVAAALALVAARPVADYDVVFAHARIVDGTGAPWARGDVGVRGDRIAAIGDLSAASSARRIDVHDHVIAPGFIDLLGQSELNLLIDNRGESKIRQGITTEFTGELFSAAPLRRSFMPTFVSWFAVGQFGVTANWTELDGYFAALQRARPAMNLGTFVAAGSIRAAVVGLADVQPSAAQMTDMERLANEAMSAGAFGVSSSLGYPPSTFARTPELTALAAVAAAHGGIYATHMRHYGKEIFASLDEVFAIARDAHVPVEIWHLGLTDDAVWGRAGDVIAAIERARASGLDITADNYPYEAGQNALDSQLPDWAHDGGVDSMIARFHDPAQRAKILVDWTEGDPPDVTAKLAHRTMIASCANPAVQRYVGMRLDDVARSMGKPTGEALLDLIEMDHANTTEVIFVKDESDVRAFMRASWVALGVDSGAQATDGPFAGFGTHPRAFGAAARLIGPYVRDLKLFPLEEAIRKMTSLPARRVGLTDRGLLRPGMLADLVVFDPATVTDRATYAQPLAYADGIEYVTVNGKLVLDAGRFTAERPGRVLRHHP